MCLSQAGKQDVVVGVMIRGGRMMSQAAADSAGLGSTERAGTATVVITCGNIDSDITVYRNL